MFRIQNFNVEALSYFEQTSIFEYIAVHKPISLSVPA